MNDLIGGWDISLWDKPASEHDYRIGEHPICWAISNKQVAMYIMYLHNTKEVVQ